MFVIFCILLAGCNRQKISDNSTSDKINISDESSYPFYEVTSPIYTNLTLEHFKKLYVGMSYEEVIKIVGAPHKSENNYTKHTYVMSNGKEMVITYNKIGSVSLIEFPFYIIESPIYSNLNMTDINKLYKGMPYEEVVQLIGAAHRYTGDMSLCCIYDLKDSEIAAVGVFYKNGVVYKVVCWNKKGEERSVLS